MDIYTKVIQHDSQRKGRKSSELQGNTRKSLIRGLSEETITKAKPVLGNKVQTGYVESNAGSSSIGMAKNCYFKPAGKCGMTLTTDIYKRKKKRQGTRDGTENSIVNLKGERRNKQHEEAIRIQKLNNYKDEDDFSNLKLRRINKRHKGAVRIKKFTSSKMRTAIKLKRKRENEPHEEAITIQKVNDFIDEDGISNFKLRRRNKQHKDANRIKKLNNSKMKIAIKLKRKDGNKPLEEAIRIQKLDNSKDKDGISDLKLKCRSKQYKEGMRIKKLNNSKMKSTVQLQCKFRNKPHEEAVGIRKLNNSEGIIPANMSPVAGPKHSHTLLLDKVQSSISAMLQLRDAEASLKVASLFMDEAQPVYLVVQCIKIPKMCNQHFRFRLPHPLIDKSSEVCLFVPDLKKGKNEDHEPTVEHYKDLLKKNNVTGISQVMPLRQVRMEYDQYELRRCLVSQFDLFLSDGRIAGHMLHLLGKEVYKRRKLPVPVNMKAKNLKDELETALCKTLMMMNACGNKASLKVGHTNQSVLQIAENIMAIAECLAEHYPGGWDNIRSLHIHLQDSPRIPVYITLKSRSDMKVPVVKPVIPRKAKPVEGELSTFPGTYVTVMPSGEVIVKKMEQTEEDKEMGLSDSDWEEYNSEEEMDEDTADPVPKVLTDEKADIESQPGSEEEESEASSDDGNEHVAETAEDAYLAEWTKQWNENIKHSTTMKRKQNKANNEPKEVPEKKKRKIIKSKGKKQKAKEDKHETLEKKKQKMVKIMKPQANSKECKLAKEKTGSFGSPSLPKRKFVKNGDNKGKRVQNKKHKKTLSTKLTKKVNI